MPKLIHLRESGNLEQEADTVFALMRGVAWSDDDEPRDDQAALSILKARNAPLSTVHLSWNGPTTSFSDPAMARYDRTFDAYSGEEGF